MKEKRILFKTSIERASLNTGQRCLLQEGKKVRVKGSSLSVKGPPPRPTKKKKKKGLGSTWEMTSLQEATPPPPPPKELVVKKRPGGSHPFPAQFPFPVLMCTLPCPTSTAHPTPGPTQANLGLDFSSLRPPPAGGGPAGRAQGSRGRSLCAAAAEFRNS